ncbi:cytochrome o ubiquinol oxidase subunit III [Candidatus Pantoea edessiphila]|uniref:Cytochrome bo(3) ubiquinol oxidase subunit 3 n=1 Tax=Candidatus Pantoea edessiphila TaxID=2044610 RepID=A0A2P5SXF7_9GAMM|nr:cytochrome o ubiquinol oxidase subunit III [Candidatus Pantoea edessiphila]MBK4775795.1 cytochrome o ubiquinol oxidase subunit III [Pantoea sp. Edef]PPI87021.1 cytochrome o ubiquinol oxidase subunit III [Candidatus Pantoea edessiphila]
MSSESLKHYNHMESNKIFGFWIYLMSDCIIFAILFATYVVMINNTADGPTGKDIFELPFVLIETSLLLLSSVTCGMSVVSINKKTSNIIFWLTITFLLGLVFIGMEFYEFYNLIKQGYGPNKSGFLSSFFTVVGTHGIHVVCGLIWILVLVFQILVYGKNINNITRIMCFSLFWHFLDIIWILVFTIVYLMGVI